MNDDKKKTPEVKTRPDGVGRKAEKQACLERQWRSEKRAIRLFGPPPGTKAYRKWLNH